MDIILFLVIVFVYAVLGYKKPGIALMILPIGMVLPPLYVAVTRDITEALFAAGVFAPIIFVTTLVAILGARREPDFKQWAQVCAKWLLISLIFGLLCVAAFVVLGSGGLFGLVLILALIGFLISYGITSRHATAAYVISTIGSSMRQNLPLPMALESAVSGRTDKRSRALRGIQKWLVQGYALSESIKRGYPRCPGYAVAMIAAAEGIDQLPLAIKAVEADMTAKADESRKVRPIHPLYLVVLICFLFFIVLGLMTFVIPKFKEVLEDMFAGEQLPAVTRCVLGVADYIAYDAGAFFLVALGFLVFVVFPVWIRARFRPRRPQKPYLISRAADFVKWHLPVLQWFEKNYSLVQVVELLRLSLNAGSTINDAIANTLNLDINNSFRGRLKRWLVRVQAGDNIGGAARESKLGSTLAWAFDEQVNQGNTLAILETLESFYRSNYGYRVNLARFIMWPCITIMMGIVVGLVVYAIFSPGVAVVRHLSSIAMP